jgi:hypothetical protein
MRLWPSGALKSLPLILLILLVSVVTAPAQAPSGRLHGQVTDPSGAVIPNATIILKNSSGLTIAAKSDSAGAYDVKVAPGKYTVTVQAKGFTASTSQMEIVASQDRKLDFPLDIQTKEEEIVVEGEGAKVSTNPDNNASTLVISGKDLDALSDDPDELQSELQALAGPSAGPNGGQIYIDGFTGGQLPPKSSIREIRINQNPFSAQYDRMGFGRIEILTKPGTDKPHGQFFYNDNHSIFDTLNPFGSGEPDFSSEMINANVGGPLSKKASYFVNVERRDIHDAAVILGSAFSADGQQPVGVLNPRIRTNVSARLDYQLAANNTLMVRYQFTHNNEQNDGLGQFSLPSQAYNLTSTEHTVQIADTQVLSAKVINETRFEWQRDTTDQNALTLAPQVSTPQATIGGNPIGVGAINLDHYELQNYTSVNLNTHFLRMGGRLRATANTTNSTQGFNGSYFFATPVNLNSGPLPVPNQLTFVTGNPLVSNTFVDAGIYAEDDWKLRPNMTLSYGLRFETQNGIHDHRDWAPRVGFAWGIGAKKNAQPKTILRTGFGIFYDRFNQNLIMQAEQFSAITHLQQKFIISDQTAAGQACLTQAIALYPTVPSPSSLSCIASFGTTSYEIDPNLRAPYTIQAVASLERQINKVSTLTVTYIHSHGVHQLFSVDSNYNPLNPSVAPPIFDYVSEGVFTQNQIMTQFNVRAGAKLTLFSFYAFSHANGDTSGASSVPSDPTKGVTADYGRTAYDVHHRLFLGGTYALPHGFRVSPFLVANSGAPFNITTGQDFNDDSVFNDRPALASIDPGTTASSCRSASLAAPVCLAPGIGMVNLFPAVGTPTIPLNFGNGPAQFTLNMRLSKTFGIGPKLETAAGSQPQKGGNAGGGRAGGPAPGGGGPRGPGGPMGAIFGGDRSSQKYSLTFSANARNIFNMVNPGTPVGNLSSPLFGQSTSLAGGIFNTQSANRRIDFQVMFAF